MKTILLLALLTVLGGCATSTSMSPKYDVRLGDALRQARLRMTIDPSAGTDSQTVLGMDGRAAHESLMRYQDSFKAPPPVVNVINIGGVGGGSGGSK